MENLDKLTKQNIEKAVQMYDRLGREAFFTWCKERMDKRQEFTEPKRFYLFHPSGRRKYEIRPIVVAAYCIRTKKKFHYPVYRDDAIRRKLCGLGFKLVSKETGEPVCPGTGNGQAHQPDQSKKTAVEDAAMKMTREHFEKLKWWVDDVSDRKLGWDMEAKRNGKKLFLEVKGLSGSRLGVELTPREYEQMKAKAARYQVCIVVHALHDTKHDLSIFSPRANNTRLVDKRGRELQVKEAIAARLSMRRV